MTEIAYIYITLRCRDGGLGVGRLYVDGLVRWIGGWVHGVVGGSVLDGMWLGSGAHVFDGGKISCG